MSFKLSVSMGGNTDNLFVSRLGKNFWQRLGIGFRKAGTIAENQIKRNLSGPGRSAGNSKRARKIFKQRAPFSRLGEFPGVVSGRLRQSVRSVVRGSAGGLMVEIGPNRKYARIHELGGMAGPGRKVQIPARPYIWPAHEKRRKEILAAISKELMRR